MGSVEAVILAFVLGFLLALVGSFADEPNKPAYGIGPHHHLDQRAYNQEVSHARR